HELDPLGQEFTRRLSIGESVNVIVSAGPPPDGVMTPRIVAERGLLAEDETQPGKTKTVSIPRHPDLSADAQYRVPAEHCKRLLCEYARFVAQHYPSEKDPSAKPVRVKIYRVVHRLLEPNEMANPWEFPDPQAEWTYWPYYQGEFVPPPADPNNLDPNRAWVLK